PSRSQPEPAHAESSDQWPKASTPSTRPDREAGCDRVPPGRTRGQSPIRLSAYDYLIARVTGPWQHNRKSEQPWKQRPASVVRSNDSQLSVRVPPRFHLTRQGLLARDQDQRECALANSQPAAPF